MSSDNYAVGPSDKQVVSLTKTIHEMEVSNPTMGVKWKTGMLRYYRRRLAELMLTHTDRELPTSDQIDELELKLRETWASTFPVSN